MVDNNHKDQNSRMLTVRQASRILNVHPNTLRRWSEHGIIKSYRIGPRGDRRFKLEDIDQLIAEQAEDKGTGAIPNSSDAESKAGSV